MIFYVLRKLFTIYPGEEKNALLFALLGFLWALAVTAGLKFADVLFLLHVGAEYLPAVYTSTSCAMIVLASFLLYLYHHIPVNKIYLSAIGVGVVFYLFAFLCVLAQLGTESGWLWYALRIFGSLFFTVTLTCFWTFIDQYYSLQDAKRLYCLFSSVIFLGYGTTGSVMRSGLVEIPVVTLAIAALLLASGFLIYKISQGTRPVHDDSASEEQSASLREKYSLGTLLKTIASSRFTMLLLLGNFMIYVLLVLTEYNYMLAFQERYDPGGSPQFIGNEEDAPLTQFLGQWLAIVSITNLLFGLFLYSRIVRRHGIGSLLICTPAIWLIMFSGWSFSDALVFPILGLFVVEGTLIVIDDNNFNLLLNAIPSKIKNKTRVIIESFFEPVGMFVSSLLLAVPWLNSKHLGLFLSVLFVVIIFFQKRQYGKAIYSNLAEHAVHFERPLAEWLTGGRRRTLLAYASSQDPSTLLFAARSLSSMGDTELLEAFIERIVDPDAKESVRMLLRPQLQEDVVSLYELLPLLDTPETAKKAARSIAAFASPKDVPLAPLLLQRLRHLEDGELTVAFLTALSKMKDLSLARPIVEASLHFRPGERRQAESIIAEMGEEAIPSMIAVLRDAGSHDRCRALAGRALSRLSLKELRKYLYEVVSTQIEKASFYFYHYHTIQEQYPHIDLHLLVDGLHTGYHSAMDFILQLLSAAGELEDPVLLSRALRSPHPKTRSQVVEALEKTCETKIFRLLQPLVEDRPLKEKFDVYLKGSEHPYTLDDVITKLSYSPSPVDQIIVATLKKHLNTPHWREGLRIHLADKDPLFQHFVMELLDS